MIRADSEAKVILQIKPHRKMDLKLQGADASSTPCTVTDLKSPLRRSHLDAFLADFIDARRLL